MYCESYVHIVDDVMGPKKVRSYPKIFWGFISCKPGRDIQSVKISHLLETIYCKSSGYVIDDVKIVASES